MILDNFLYFQLMLHTSPLADGLSLAMKESSCGLGWRLCFQHRSWQVKQQIQYMIYMWVSKTNGGFGRFAFAVCVLGIFGCCLSCCCSCYSATLLQCIFGQGQFVPPEEEEASLHVWFARSTDISPGLWRSAWTWLNVISCFFLLHSVERNMSNQIL